MSTRAQLDQLFASLLAHNITAVRLHGWPIMDSTSTLAELAVGCSLPAQLLQGIDVNCLLGTCDGIVIDDQLAIDHRLRRCSGAGGA